MEVLKKYFRYYPILIILGFIIYFYHEARQERINFHDRKINSIIISKDDFIKNKSHIYYLNDGKDFTLKNNHKLIVSDSISKFEFTWRFDVYRKMDKKYEFLETINNNK